ncbi:MAG: DUF2089 domain-containing protein [Erysipelotrichia bacterium]|nr:DUF2089 domain-containing protein [Erysipelotrichia bacterium]
MYVSRYTCKTCNIELSGNFGVHSDQVTNLFSLSNEESDFIKMFLKFEGNIKKVQEHSHLGYMAIKTKINEINIKLGNEGETGMKDLVKTFDEVDTKSPSGHIKELLSASGGKAEVSMLRGEPMKIWATEEGVRNSFYPTLICEWRIFDAIVIRARELGGRMYRGDAESQQGKRIGSKEFSLDTIDAFISLKFYGNEIGSTTTRRSTYYAAILDWAKIARNNRSKGLGGYIQLSSNWK